MAQPQQQQYPPPAPYQTLQGAPPPSLQNFNLPPHKRQRLNSPQQPQPGSPYHQSPYTNISPVHSPSTPIASPHFSTVGLPTGVYTTPYAASGNANTLSIPQASSAQPNMPHYQQPPLGFPGQNANNQTPNFNNNYGLNTMGTGAMGPPSKPVDKGKEDGIDPMDVLGGTGVDLREEEQYSFQMINNSFNAQLSGSQSGAISASNSYTQFPPGDPSALYGAGPANGVAEKANTKTQDEFNQLAANKAWEAAAHSLSMSRSKELSDPFLKIALMHVKMEKVAAENGIQLNVDKSGMMGHMKLPGQFENREVKVQTVGNNTQGFMTMTSGEFVPHDSMLVDHLALLSIAAKHRIRGLLEEANKLAIGRQTGSHGIVPEDWADVAAPIKDTSSSIVADDALRSGWESAVSPRSSTLKRSFSSVDKMPTPISDGGKTPVTAPKITNEVLVALRSSSVKERDREELRMKRRLGRANGDASVATPRAGSIIPGTPGSIAPEALEKVPTKKEQKKKADAKVNEAASHAAANVTTAAFLGGGGGIFGKKKKYNWMTSAAGTGGSGASTPGRLNTQGLPGTPAAPAAPERLTADGVRRLGTWREDRDKGKNIQLRDWVAVLEEDGHDKRSLQKAYLQLENSEPK